MIEQLEITLPQFKRGYHLITSLIEKQLPPLPEKGLLHILVKHTSVGITINENADPSVRSDFESFINKMIPENDPVYVHIYEGSDDISSEQKDINRVTLLEQKLNSLRQEIKMLLLHVN